MIQRQVRRLWALRRVRLLYQKVVKVLREKETGFQYFANYSTNWSAWELPSFMAGRYVADATRPPPAAA